MKITKEGLKNGLELTVYMIGLGLGAFVLTLAGIQTGGDDLDEIFDDEADYGKAIRDICDSDMSDYFKDQCIKAIRKDENEGYYRAISSIAESDMSDYFKNEAISKLK